MRLDELDRDRIVELKQALLTEREGSVSYEELANADELVSDEELAAKWGGVCFTEDDFFSGAMSPPF